MKYNNTVTGRFIARPNRFIAHVEVDGAVQVCHVKNTGRCRELLTPGARVILQRASNPQRKTPYDVIAVYKGDRLINMDSQAPNPTLGEWLGKRILFPDMTLIKPECQYKNSRFDFYMEAGECKIFAEVKGVTLEQDGVVLFPDAPTERGVKHLRELMDAAECGYEAYVFFVIQMKGCKYFTPNAATHPEFAETLRQAAAAGVNIVALDCHVTENSLEIGDRVQIVL